MSKLVIMPFWKLVYANDLDALVPEVWAQESLMILEANMVTANLVHRDFEDEIAQFGDTVNTRRPATFEGKRKVDGDDVTVQDASATNVPVVLNQHLHTSFMIHDGEESKGFKNLVVEYLTPALMSIAQMIDEIIMGQVYEFLAYHVGQLGTDLTKATVVSAKEMFNRNKAPMTGRNVVISPNAEGDLLNIGDFTKANEVGDAGSALREGHIGRKFGFDFFMCQNTPSVAAGNTVVTGEVDNVAGYPAGTTTMTVNGLSAALTNGCWFTVEGDMIPQRLVSSVGGATPTSMTFSPGLSYAVVNDADITIYTPGAVNQLVSPTGYAAGYGKSVVVDAFTVAPKIGQMISFGAAADVYGALSTPTTTGVLLNRPLNAAIADGAAVGVGPAGEYNFAFHKNALALVTRPLAAPMKGTGAMSTVANYNGLSVRVTITYNGTRQGHLVTVDLLCGTKTLDTRLGCVIFA